MDNNENKSSFDWVKEIIQKYWKVILPYVGPILLGLFSIFAMLFLVIIVYSAGAGVLGSIKDFFEDVGEGIEVFTEKVGNLFTLNGFHTNEELAHKREYQFYKELSDIQEKYLKKYGVNINTTLITATLTYNRNLGDYTFDASVSDEDLSFDKDYLDPNSAMDAADVADFYKAAKGHIKTLAEYMLLAVNSNNSCGDTAGVVRDPSTMQDVVDNHLSFWERISSLSESYGFRKLGNVYLGYNLQEINRTVLHNTVDNPNGALIVTANGNTHVLPTCDYEDVTQDMITAWLDVRLDFDNQLDEAFIGSTVLENYKVCIEEVQSFINTGIYIDGYRTECDAEEALLNDEIKKYEEEFSKHDLVSNGFFNFSIKVNELGTDVYIESNNFFNCTGDFSLQERDSIFASKDDYKQLKIYNGCALAPESALIYSVNYIYNEDNPSLYQANLKAPMKDIFSAIPIFKNRDSKSFIQDYNKEWVYDKNGNEIEGKVDEIVKGIYSLYDFVSSRRTSYGEGEWNEWKQKDPLWGSVTMGPGTATIARYGCLMTSYAIQIMNSGSPVNISDFNPGTFVQGMGPDAFDAGGWFLGGIERVAPYFKCTSLEYQSSSILVDSLRAGKWPIVQVYNPMKTGKTHWVAIIGEESGNPIMADPASNNTDLFATYPEIRDVIQYVKICENTG